MAQKEWGLWPLGRFSPQLRGRLCLSFLPLVLTLMSDYKAPDDFENEIGADEPCYSVATPGTLGYKCSRI